MAAIRRTDVTWEGALASGSGVTTASTSGVFSQLPVTWASRTESADGRTSPEELIAAAHASCFAMAFSHGLGESGTPLHDWTSPPPSPSTTWTVDGRWSPAR